MILWVGFGAQGATAHLVQCDYFQRRLTAVPVSPGLRLRLEDRRKDVSLEDLRSRYRSLPPSALRRALEAAVGLEGLDYLIGEATDLDLILRPEGGQVQVMPTAQRQFDAATQVGRLVSSLRRKDIDLLQRTSGS
jgi:hypothetical protein